MAYVICVLRVAIGILLIVAGAFKAHDGIVITGENIAGYRLLPTFAVMPLALFLPYFEIGIGIYMVLGLFTRVTASIVAFQIAVFAAAIASVVARHIHISCGCFGSADTAIASWADVARDSLLVFVCAAIAWKAPGAFALDSMMAKAEQEGSGNKQI